MTALPVVPIAPAAPRPDAGLGTLSTPRGNLPLDRLDVRARISGLVARTVVTTEFVNAFDEPLEATYVFPLPDRAAVTGMTMTADDRTIEADLRERGAAREAYDAAIAAGQRASIAEEERPDVFTMRVGNILPGERVTVTLSLTGPLAWEDDAATFRFPLVVAPRYVPGTPLPGEQAGDGRVRDTDAVPDASRITPPVLLPGFPHPLRLSIGVDLDTAGLPLSEVRSSLHAVTQDGGRIEILPGERADRDFILRLPYSGSGSGAVFVPDADGGTYQMVVLPPAAAGAPRPKDVVLLLDRSGSMHGWKMVTARRATARIVDTLTAADRFAVLTFDNHIDRPASLGDGLSEATDRNRFRAVEWVAGAQARGGTEILAPLQAGLRLLSTSEGRDRVLVLITDGQVGNEDQILAHAGPLASGVRVHTVGIDRAVNAGFLGRLAAAGAGRCELVESEDRLDEAMDRIHRRIAAPLVTGVTVSGFPARRPESIFPGVPLVLFERASGDVPSSLTVRGRTRDDAEFTVEVPVRRSDETAVTAQWARARLRELEDRYTIGEVHLEPEIVATSLRHRVLCRFTAWLAVDTRVVTEGGTTRRVTQPVESPSGWETPDALGAGRPGGVHPGGMRPAGLRRAAGGGFRATAADGGFRTGGGGFRAGGAASFSDAPAFGAPPPAPPASAPSPTESAPPAYAPPPASSGGGPVSPSPRPAAPESAPAPKATPSPTPRPAPRPAPRPVPSASPSPAMAPMVSAARDVRPEPRAELAAFARTEVTRLRESAELSIMERRDLLDDLATRLHAVLTGVPESEVRPLAELKRLLLSGLGDLATLWSESLRLLDAFVADTGDTAGEGPQPKRRKPFWK
ncbi:Ca-activated chloride channel family protein [Catenuloplanes nepalensis]|uniref:Ca-activated chloride channel family protein n=1 Tax=Catenuloplanes nepalensis TaxID=587533 RepID=A0ABT9MND4_9ACTN|nr:VIT domain-containing protein [Catenuloplanes nepalensis]MDP9792798.1 Ca-activated chloride channel family protein [Catenuloplanes nepalensis]